MRSWPAALIIFTVLFYQCNEAKVCSDPVNTLMITSLKISDFRVFDSLVIRGVGKIEIGDTLVNDTLSSQSKRFPLPLSLSEDSTGFVIQSGNLTDTVYIKHSMTMKFISEYCGFAPEYSIMGFKFTTGIDSIKITDPIVNTLSLSKNIDDQNITVYINPSVH